MLIYTGTILLGFVKLCSNASVVQTKQYNMKPTKKKKEDNGFIYSISL